MISIYSISGLLVGGAMQGRHVIRLLWTAEHVRVHYAMATAATKLSCTAGPDDGNEVVHLCIIRWESDVKAENSFT